MISRLFSCLAAFLYAGAPLSLAQPAGAQSPWITYGAGETIQYQGEWLASRQHGEIANEALARRCLLLADDGDFAEWRVLHPANAIVVRHSIPDAATGGGTEATLSLFVNDVFRQQLDLSSHYAWLYGSGENAQSNDPASGTPHRFFDDARAFIAGAPLEPDDILRIQKVTAEGNVADWYAIDLIDLEFVEPPAAMPAGALNVLDFGAVADDGQDDTEALEAAIVAAASQTPSPVVWIPAGTFHQNRQLLLAGVTVKGAGPWHSRLAAWGPATEAMGFPGNLGFRLTADGASVSDLMIEGNTTARTPPRQHAFSSTAASNIHIENVWVEHAKTGMWLGDCAGGLIRNVRVRNTYADGINLNNGSHSITIEHTHTRNTGDDGLAVYSNTGGAGTASPCYNVTLRHNTIDAPWWAHGIGIYGGTDITAEKNLIRGTSRGPGVKIAVTSFHSMPTWPGQLIHLDGNVILDSGGTSYGRRWGAIWVYVAHSGLHGLSLTDNQMIGADADAIRIQGNASTPSATIDVTLQGNTVSAPLGHGIHVTGGTQGTLQLQAGNTFNAIPAGKAEVNNLASATFTIDEVDIP